MTKNGFSLAVLAEKLKARLKGAPAKRVYAVKALDEASSRDLSFYSNPRYLKFLKTTKAGAVIVPPGIELKGGNLLIAENPYLAFARALTLFYPESGKWSGINPQAIIAKSARIAKEVSIHPNAFVGENVRIARNVTIYPGAVIGADSSIGEGSVIFSNVTIYCGTKIGKNARIHAGSVIGSDGFGYAKSGKEHIKIPQIGTVVIEDDVEIGANVTIDRATLGKTIIKKGVKIDNLVQIGHNVVVGERTILVGQVGISGSTHIGKDVIFAGQSGAVGHINIGDGAIVGAKSAVTKDVPSGTHVTGHPALPHKEWLKIQAELRRLAQRDRKEE